MHAVDKKPIYCIGGANIDYKFKTKTSPQLGSSNPVKSFRSFGGVARNVADNLANVTQNIYFQSIVGNDSKTEELLQDLADKKINIAACIKSSTDFTGQYYAILDDNNDLLIAVADMDIYDQIPFDLFVQSWQQWENNSIVFLDTNLSSDLIQYAMQLSQLKKIQLCIDPVSVEKSSKLPKNLSGITLIKPNQKEAESLSNMTIHTIDDCYAAGKILLKQGVENVVISLGSLGYVIVSAEESNHYPAKIVNSILDVNGAGDAFFSGILFGLQQAFTLSEACRIGAERAADVIQSLDSSFSPVR